MPKANRGNGRGFTLLEALVSIVIFGVGLSTFFGLFPYSLHEVQHSNIYLQAVSVGQQYMDAIRSSVEQSQPMPAPTTAAIDAGDEVLGAQSSPGVAEHHHGDRDESLGDRAGPVLGVGVGPLPADLAASGRPDQLAVAGQPGRHRRQSLLGLILGQPHIQQSPRSLFDHACLRYRLRQAQADDGPGEVMRRAAART